MVLFFPQRDRFSYCRDFLDQSKLGAIQQTAVSVVLDVDYRWAKSSLMQFLLFIITLSDDLFRYGMSKVVLQYLYVEWPIVSYENFYASVLQPLQLDISVHHRELIQQVYFETKATLFKLTQEHGIAENNLSWTTLVEGYSLCCSGLFWISYVSRSAADWITRLQTLLSFQAPFSTITRSTDLSDVMKQYVTFPGLAPWVKCALQQLLNNTTTWRMPEKRNSMIYWEWLQEGLINESCNRTRIWFQHIEFDATISLTNTICSLAKSHSLWLHRVNGALFKLSDISALSEFITVWKEVPTAYLQLQHLYEYDPTRDIHQILYKSLMTSTDYVSIQSSVEQELKNLDLQKRQDTKFSHLSITLDTPPLLPQTSPTQSIVTIHTPIYTAVLPKVLTGGEDRVSKQIPTRMVPLVLSPLSSSDDEKDKNIHTTNPIMTTKLVLSDDEIQSPDVENSVFINQQKQKDASVVNTNDANGKGETTASVSDKTKTKYICFSIASPIHSPAPFSPLVDQSNIVI